VLAGIKNASIASDAAIAFSKLAALDAANILVGNGSNVATKVAVTGDVTISNAGVTAIGNDKVITAMVDDAAITPVKLSQPLTLATAQNTTSGTSIDFTGIPSWAKRITLMFNGVSTAGSNSAVVIQLGDAGGLETTGYVGNNGIFNNASSTGVIAYTVGFCPYNNGNAAVVTGSATITNISANTWIASGVFGRSDTTMMNFMNGSKTLSDTLTQLRLTTINGTDTFDAGEVNIMYEG